MSKNILGLAHIGIMVSDLEVSKAFYRDILDFEVVHQNAVIEGDIVTGVLFMGIGDLVLELIQRPVYDGTRKDGYVDHIALKVKDIEKVRDNLSKKGIEYTMDDVFTCDTLFEKGAKWILFKGPDNESLELNEIL